jgi:hypothetical protein
MSVTPSGIETATFRFAAQCLKQLRHYVILYYKARRVNHVQITDGNRRAVFSPCNFVNLQQEETKGDGCLKQ